MLTFTGSSGHDITIVREAATRLAVAALQVSSVADAKRLGETLAAHTRTTRTIDAPVLDFVARHLERDAGPQVDRIRVAFAHLGSAIRAMDDFVLHGDAAFDERDHVYFVTAVDSVYEAGRLVSQIESLAKHQPPAGSRGSRKGHG